MTHYNANLHPYIHSTVHINIRLAIFDILKNILQDILCNGKQIHDNWTVNFYDWFTSSWNHAKVS
jgi:hypothetical protein